MWAGVRASVRAGRRWAAGSTGRSRSRSSPSTGGLSGGDPRWFHVVNVLWHVAASVLVWLLAAELLAPAAALGAALLFAVAPGARRGGRQRRRPLGVHGGRVRARGAARAPAAQLRGRRSASPSRCSPRRRRGPPRPRRAARSPPGRRAARGAPERRWLYAGYGAVAVAYAAAVAGRVFRGMPLVDPGARSSIGATIGRALADLRFRRARVRPAAPRPAAPLRRLPAGGDRPRRVR